jgi:hypothetical protein
MPKPSIKVIEKKKLSDFEYYVKILYKGKEYSDAFSLPGLKLLVKNHEDKKSLNYIIACAMLNAVDKKTAKAEEVSNGSQDNSKG